MKKLVLTLVAICSIGLVSVQAQFLKLGVKGGSNITKITGSSFDEKFSYGYHLGGFIQIKLSDKLTLQPEVLMSQINTTVDSNFHNLYSNLSNPNYVRNIDLKYLTIPLVLNYNLSKFMALQGGAQYAKLMDNNQSLLQNGNSAFKSGDFSVPAGVQLRLWKLIVSGRYLIGLNNINDIDNRDQWKNQTAQLSVGLRF